MTPPTYITHNGVKRTITEWARITGLTKNAIRARLRQGLSTEEAFSRPKWRRIELNVVEAEEDEPVDIRVRRGSLEELPERTWMTGL